MWCRWGGMCALLLFFTVPGPRLQSSSRSLWMQSKCYNYVYSRNTPIEPCDFWVSKQSVIPHADNGAKHTHTHTHGYNTLKGGAVMRKTQWGNLWNTPALPLPIYVRNCIYMHMYAYLKQEEWEGEGWGYLHMYLYLFAQLIHESQSETGQTTCENVCAHISTYILYLYLQICCEFWDLLHVACWQVQGTCCIDIYSKYAYTHTHTPWFLASDFLTKIKPLYAHAGSDERQQSKEQRERERDNNNTNKCKWKCMSHSRRMHFISFYFVYLHCK